MTETTPTLRSPAALARMTQRALNAEAAVARTRALHVRKPAAQFVSAVDWCDADTEDWPCATIRALDAEG